MALFNTWVNSWITGAPVVTQMMDINTDSNCSRTTDLVMVGGSSLDLDVTMALVGSVGHSDWDGPGGSMTIGH